MEIIYCKKWWFPRKKPIEILNEETARNNHLNGEDYTVVLKQNDMVSYVVEMAKNDVFVHFMNDNELNYITYAFHKENDKLFLNAAYYHNYEAEKEIELMVFGFKENGELCMEKRDLLSGEIEEREAVVDVSCNWEEQLDGVDEIFEYIINDAGQVTHQRFIKGGIYTGFPNQVVPKGEY